MKCYFIYPSVSNLTLAVVGTRSTTPCVIDQKWNSALNPLYHFFSFSAISANMSWL